MRIAVDGHSAYAYTGSRPLAAGRPAVVFVHGAANDHSVFALQSRYFAHHGYNVAAVDLPGHGRSEGAALASIAALADWLAAFVRSREPRRRLAGRTLDGIAGRSRRRGAQSGAR